MLLNPLKIKYVLNRNAKWILALAKNYIYQISFRIDQQQFYYVSKLPA